MIRAPARDALALFCVALCLRLPFAAQTLWAWDSVLYARAIASFDVTQGQPHPPGYLFYVLLARATTWIMADANAALVAVSVVAGAAVVPLAYLAGRRISPRVGYVAAAVALASPILWFYSEVAYPYTLLALLAGALGLALIWSRHEGPRAAIVASAALGVAAGFRQDLLLILGPLWLWAMFAGSVRRVVAGALALAVGCLVWAIPTLALSDGPRYIATVASQIVGLSDANRTDADALARNVRMTLVGLRWQVHWFVPLVPLGALLVVLRRRELLVRFALWTVPALATYLVFHIGEPGYTLSIAVPLALLTGIAVDEMLRIIPRGVGPRALAIGLAACLVLNAHSFVAGTGHFSASAIRGHDVGIVVRVKTIRASFSPADTVIVAVGASQHARYYLPEFTTYHVGRRARRPLALRPGVRNVVLFLGEVRTSPAWRTRVIQADAGVYLRYVAFAAGTPLATQGDELLLGAGE